MPAPTAACPPRTWCGSIKIAALVTRPWYRPRRANWSGLVPVPGDGRYQWNSFLPIEDCLMLKTRRRDSSTPPTTIDPAGLAVPGCLALHVGRSLSRRYGRQSLRSGRMFTVSDMMQLQNSVFSIPARELIPLLRAITSPNDVTEQARQRLVHWDFNLDQDSVPAGIYEMWQRHLQENVRAAFLPEDARAVKGGPAAFQDGATAGSSGWDVWL